MLEIPADFPSELVPLSWLVGSWKGSGWVSYATEEGTLDDSAREYEFSQDVSFTVESSSVLRYNAIFHRLSDDSPVTSETGYWRIARPAHSFDAGPGLIAGVGSSPFTTAESVEGLRNDAGSFDIEAVIAHPDGIAELYLGRVDGPRIDLVTDAVLRPENARDYRAATRMFGLVEGHLLWAWDAAALGVSLRSMASARLARV